MTNRKFFATLLVGALFGSSVLLAVRGHDLDLLYLRLAECKTQCRQLEEDNRKLEEELTHAEKQAVRRVKKIVVKVIEAPDEFAKLAVQNEVKKRVQSYVNKDMTFFENSPDIFYDMLENRVFEFPSQKISLDVTYVMIGETTVIAVIAKKVENTLKPLS